MLGETAASFPPSLHEEDGRIAIGIESNASHHRSAREGWVIAVTEAVTRGATLTRRKVALRDG